MNRDHLGYVTLTGLVAGFAIAYGLGLGGWSTVFGVLVVLTTVVIYG